MESYTAFRPASIDSGFRPGFSTETAVLRVISDILATVDHGDFAALVLLDLSTAFNTVDHAVLLERLYDGHLAFQVLHWLGCRHT